MNLNRYNTIICLAILFYSLMSCHTDNKTDTANEQYHIVDELDSIPGAEMSIYDLYIDAWERNKEDESMQYAEMFISGLDKRYVNPTASDMSKKLSSYYDNKLSRIRKAAQWQEYAITSDSILGNQRQTAEDRCYLSSLYYRMHLYHKALIHAHLAHIDLSRLKDTSGLLKSYNMLGALYTYIGDTAKANSYFQKYATDSRFSNDSIHLAMALNNIAVINSSSDSTKTIRLLKESVRIASEANRPDRICSKLLNLASFFMKNNDYGNAEKMLDSTKTYLAEWDMLNNAQLYSYYGELAKIQGDIEVAIDNVKKSICYYSRTDYISELRQQYYELYLLSMTADDSSSALDALSEWSKYSSPESETDIYRETCIILDRLWDEQEHNKTLSRKLNTLKTITISLTLCAIAFVIAILYRKKNIYNTTSHTDDDTIGISEFEKIRHFQLFQTVESITNRLEEIRQTSDKPETQKKIALFMGEIKALKSSEGPWGNMEKYVPEFNKVFYRKLIRRYPDLTINERRLCMFLNMNMTTKEISEITRQSVHSINVARGRLRVKLGLANESQSIQEFLSKLENEQM